MTPGSIFKKAYRPILLGLLIIIAILVGVYTYDLGELRKFVPITTVTFPKNSLLDIQKAVIYSRNGSEVFPSDTLLLQITVVKEIPSLVAIKPLIYTTIGGIPVKSSENQMWQGLDSNQPQTFSYEFFAGTEGPNIINVAINATNPTETQRFAVFINGTSDSFDVLSTGSKLQIEQNTHALYGIIVTSIFSGTAVGFTGYQTWKSIREKKLTVRPWIGREGRSDNIALQPRTTTPPLIKIHLCNYGQIPALKIITRAYADVNPPPENAFQSCPPGPEFSLTPNERFTSRIEISDAEYAKGVTGILYYGLLIEYTDPNGTKGEYRLQGHFEHNSDIFDKMDVR